MGGMLSGPVLSSGRDQGRLSKRSYEGAGGLFFSFFFKWREISCGQAIKEDEQIRRLQEQSSCLS